MQRMFAEDTEWRTPWVERALPKICELVAFRPERTLFTRFIPVRNPGEGQGTWRRYYAQWSNMTLQSLGSGMIDVIPELIKFIPPARQLDKRVYSPWWDGRLHASLKESGVRELIVSGGETDVCVLSTVLGAVDLGYRVVLATDALCSSSDRTHDALMTVYIHRYDQQIEAVTTEVILDSWQA